MNRIRIIRPRLPSPAAMVALAAGAMGVAIFLLQHPWLYTSALLGGGTAGFAAGVLARQRGSVLARAIGVGVLAVAAAVAGVSVYLLRLIEPIWLVGTLSVGIAAVGGGMSILWLPGGDTPDTLTLGRADIWSRGAAVSALALCAVLGVFLACAAALNDSPTFEFAVRVSPMVGVSASIAVAVVGVRGVTRRRRQAGGWPIAFILVTAGVLVGCVGLTWWMYLEATALVSKHLVGTAEVRQIGRVDGARHRRGGLGVGGESRRLDGAGHRVRQEKPGEGECDERRCPVESGGMPEPSGKG